MNQAIFKSYPGGKGSDGVYQTIINHIPPHDFYLEPCAGGAAIARKKADAKTTYLNDIDPEVAEQLIIYFEDRIDNPKGNQVLVMNTDWISFMKDAIPASSMYRKQTFVYLDPPYPKSCRSQKKRDLYRYEMTDGQHESALAWMVEQEEVKFMISSFRNELYNYYLKDWNQLDFPCKSRGGPTIETICYNYDIHQTGLHEYTYYGSGYREREKLNKMIRRKIAQLEAMEPLKRTAIIQAINQRFLAERP